MHFLARQSEVDFRIAYFSFPIKFIFLIPQVQYLLYSDPMPSREKFPLPADESQVSKFTESLLQPVAAVCNLAVSYTHLDVYKRQG